MSLILLMVAAACTSSSPPPPPPLLVAGSPEALEPADAVAVADLDGDGHDELVRVRAGVAYWWDQQAELGGQPQAVGTGDPDGDGRDAALIATGMGRGAPDAPARLWAIEADGAKLLWERRTARSQVTDLHVVEGAPGQPDRIFLAAFDDERSVQGGFIEQGTLQVQHEAALGMRMLPVTEGLLVGRLYGDQPKSPGDLTLVAEPPRLVPTLRGVRALAAADLDADGLEDWIIADGWHFAYGQQADATIRVVPGNGAPARVIARLEDSYTVDRLEVATPADGGPPVILASGSHEIVLLQRDGLGWAPVPVAAARETDNAVLARTAQGLSVVVSGQPARRVPLARGAAMLQP